MKKNLLSLGLIAATAFTLTNCTQEIANPVEPSVDGVPFEIIASPLETKTTNDGMSTVWATGDAINLFHAVSGATEYENDGKFEFVEGNTFKGTLTEALSEDNIYNLYALYPYNSNIKTPGERTSGYLTVGSTSSKAQVQNGNSSTAHIAGENYPLGGVYYDWDGGSEVPVQVEMSHLTTLLEVVVTNQTGKPLVVESVSFTGSDNIVGTYFIDITGNTPSFTESGTNYVSKTAVLTVLDGEPIPNGGTEKFYLAIKPFDSTGDITLAVNNIPKTKTASTDKFVAGTVKALNYTMLATDVLETSDIVNAIDVADNSIVQIEGLVVAKYDRGALVQDETGVMLVYNGSSMDENIGDKVIVSGTKTTYAGFAQIKTPTIKVLSTGNTVTYPTPKVLDAIGMDNQLTSKTIDYIQYTGKLTVSGTYYNVSVDGTSTAIGSIQYPEASLGLATMNNKPIKVTGYFIGVSSSKYVNTMAVNVEAEPYVDVVSSASVNAEIETYSLEVKSNTNWTAVPSAGLSLDKSSGDGDATVVLTFAANTTSDPLTHTVTFTFGDSDVEFTLTQKGVPSSGDPVVVFEETFAKFDGTMGWSGSAAQGNTTTTDNDGWTLTKPYGAGGSAKFGTGSAQGSAVTPALNFTGTATLTFKAGAWDGSSEGTTLNLTMTGGTLSVGSVTLVKGQWTEYEVSITGATPGAKITFAAKNKSNNRFFLDDVKITQ